MDFAPVTAVDGDLRAVASQVTRAIAWVGANAGRLGGDPDRIFLAGHSSGAHLAAAAVTADWTALEAAKDILKGALLVSGIYDLRPVRMSARNSYVRLDDTSEAALSPARHLNGLDVPLIVAWGSKNRLNLSAKAKHSFRSEKPSPSISKAFRSADTITSKF